MRAHRVLPPLLSALLLAALTTSDNSPSEPLLAVVESTERVLQTGASARVCRGAGGAGGAGGARDAGGAGGAAGECGAALACTPEAGEPLARAAATCAAAARGADAALAGGDARDLRLAAEAAARAALPLLLLDPAPPRADATWEALQLYPHDSVLAEAVAALCTAKDWQRAVLLHEGGGGGAALLANTDDEMPATGSPTLALTARKLPPEDDALRNMLLVLKKSGVTEFIVWCSAACSRHVLDTAQRVGLLGERHSYILTALDLHTLDLADYSHGGANVTALRLFDPESPELNETLAQWEQQYVSAAQTSEDAAASAAPLAAQLRAAPPVSLVLGVVGAALMRAAAARLRLPRAAPADCRSGRAAFHADTLLNYLRSEEWSVEGGGGAVSWEWDGARRAVPLQVVELQRGGAMARVGRWAPSTPVVWERVAEPAPEPPPGSMQNRTFTILIAKNEPYVMIQESTRRLTGNKRYEGFCIELIERLAELLHFNYTFVRQPDDVYGSYNVTTNSWTGMVRRLMDDDSIDFAITDLTITAERESAVDFTTPFMNLGISILYRTPKQPEPEFFAFLLPFSKGVWVCLGFAYLGTSLVLYVVGRLSPEEWQNPYPCVEEPPALENQFTLGNALWFNLGAMLLQGSEIAPVAYSTRAVASVWWLFALVITSSYTANLATLLAKKSADQPIHNVNELADNTVGIDYGAKHMGSTYNFFEHSQNELFQRMFQHMSQHTMPGTNEDGVARVTSGYDYAFLMESTTIEYIVQRNCNVTMLGSLLDSKGYGIAMKKNSTYRQALNLGLLKLQEAGTLRQMKNTWWNEKHGGGACNPGDDRESAELSMSNFLGLFVVLVVGCALGVVLSAADLAWAALRRARLYREPYLRRLWRELCFVFHFDHSVKPVQGPMSDSTSPTSTSPRTSPGAAEEAPEEEWHEAHLEAKRTSASATPRRRRSSMHAASLRLARHAARHSGTPAPY